MAMSNFDVTIPLSICSKLKIAILSEFSHFSLLIEFFKLNQYNLNNFKDFTISAVLMFSDLKAMNQYSKGQLKKCRNFSLASKNTSAAQFQNIERLPCDNNISCWHQVKIPRKTISIRFIKDMKKNPLDTISLIELLSKQWKESWCCFYSQLINRNFLTHATKRKCHRYLNSYKENKSHQINFVVKRKVLCSVSFLFG